MTPVRTIDVDTALGRLRGEDLGSHLRFLGVPFAADTGGPRRFLPPGPAEPWAGVRDALVPGAVAPQDPLVPPPFRAEGEESEDCLRLDVHTPAADGAGRPVLFWIHGGGFSHGAGCQPSYDGGPLAARGDVVVVCVRYRLGALGYLYLGGHGGAGWGAATNAGQLDQIAALRWVRDNIAAFGGDPGNVTIFGQSAGGVAVSTLLAMPAARGLFHKAIAQSGTANRLGSTDTATRLAASYLERVGVPDASPDALRSLAVDALLKAQGARGALAPIVDGDSVPVAPIDSLAAGAAADVPLLIGTTRDEQKLYVRGPREAVEGDALVAAVRGLLPRRAAERAQEVLDVYRASRAGRGLPASGLDLLDAIGTTSRFRLAALKMAETQRRHQERTYVYEFDWSSPARGGSLGACHGLEIPFVFGTLGRPGFGAMAGAEGGPALADLSCRMMDAWIAFARSGSPAHAGLGPWPAYDETTRATMVFDTESGVVERHFEEERAVWSSMVSMAVSGAA